LKPDIRKALAKALRPVGVSEVKLTLKQERRRGRGRPQVKRDFKNVLEDAERDARLAEGTAAGEKKEALIASEPCSRSKVFARSHEARERKLAREI
jgi:hypothetical protein